MLVLGFVPDVVLVLVLAPDIVPVPVLARGHVYELYNSYISGREMYKLYNSYTSSRPDPLPGAGETRLE